MPTLKQLRYLVAVADAGHFGRAALAVHVAQPSLSQQVAALEARLGTKLIERHANGATLTPIGRDIVERARTVLVAVTELEKAARRAATGAIGTLRLGTTPTLGPYLLPHLISSLHASQANLRLFVREGMPDAQAAEVSRGELDLVLGPLPLDGHDLVAEPLFREPLRLVAATDHPLAEAEAVDAEELVGAEVLVLEPRYPLHRQVSEICGRYGMRVLRDYEGTSLDSLRQMAGTRLGLTVLPELYLCSEVGGTAGVRVLNVRGWSATRSIGAAWRQRAAFAANYRELAGQVQDVARTILAGSPHARAPAVGHSPTIEKTGLRLGCD